MADQNIDSLTVSVGLSSQEFQAGIKQIRRSIEGMQTSVKTAQEGMGASFAQIGASIAGLAGEFAALFIAVRGIEDLVGYFKNLSVELANLGFAARNLGTSGVELSRWGEVAKLAGGQAQDAMMAVQGLQASIFGLRFQGQMGQNLLMLQRLGVGYLNAAGQMRPFKDIALETAAALERQLPGQANRAMRVQWAAQIFGAGGIANAIGGGLAETRRFYSESHKNQKSLTEREIDAQVQMRRHLIENSYAIKSSSAAILDSLTPVIDELILNIQKYLIPALDDVANAIRTWMHPGKALADAASGPMGITHPINDIAHIIAAVPKAARIFAEPFMRAKIAATKIPPSVLARLPPGTDLDVLKIMHYTEGGDSGDPNWSKAILDAVPNVPPTGSLVTPGASRYGLIDRTHPKNASHPTSSLSGPRVTIGSMTINTQATDAKGLAADMDRALSRKLLVSQADPGLA